MTLQAIYRNKGGFVIIEILIAIAIISSVAFLATPLYTNLQVSTQLNESVTELIQTVRLAQVKSIARVNDSSHGVYFQSDKYTLYQGGSYSGRNSSYDKVVTIEEALTLSNDLTSNEVNFSRGLGSPNATGTITITHDVQGTKNISIDDLGSIQ